MSSSPSATSSESSYDWMDEARMSAAQCWCDPETSGNEMDATLAEAFAKRLSSWMRDANRYARNADYWRNRAEVSEAVNRLVASSETKPSKTFEEWLSSVEADYPEIRLTRTKNLLRDAWFAAAGMYANPSAIATPEKGK